MIPESHEAILHSKAVAVIASIGKRGEPHASPVWFGWDGNHIKFSCTADRQKTANISREERVSVLIMDPDDPYRYLEIRGRASIQDDPEKAFVDEMAQKYIGRPFTPGPEDRVVVSIKPERVIAYPTS